MSVIDMLTSMQQIQSQLGVLSSLNAVSSSASAATSSAAFDQVVAAQTSSTSPVTSTGSSGGPTGADVVADAKKYLGIPYVLDGESTSGMDCSGLVQKTFKDLGVTLPRGVREQKTMGTAIPSLAQAQPGDLIVFKGGGHIAIYAGNNTVIHAPYPGRKVSEQKLWVGDSGIETIRRIVPSGSSTPAAVAAPSSSTTATTTATTVAAAQQAVVQAELSMLQALSAATGSSSSANSSGSLGGLGTSGLSTVGSSATGTSTIASSSPTSLAAQLAALGSPGTTPASVAQFMANVDAMMQQGATG